MSLRLSVFGGAPLGLMPLGFGPNPMMADASPVVFETDLAIWLNAKLGAPVYWGTISEQEKTRPVVRLNLIDGDALMNLAGPAGLSTYHIQMDIFGSDPADTAHLGVVLRNLLSGYRGQIGRAFCQGVFRDRVLNDFTTAVDDSDEGTYRTMSEWTFQMNDSPPPATLFLLSPP